MSREIRWDGHGWIRKEQQVECPMDDCIPLFSVDSSSFGDTINSISMPFRGWELLAEHILSERDRRREEAAKQPKRWFVRRVGLHNEWSADPAIAWGPSNPAMGVEPDGSIDHIYVMAKDAREAELKAREAELTFGVFAREYLA